MKQKGFHDYLPLKMHFKYDGVVLTFLLTRKTHAVEKSHSRYTLHERTLPTRFSKRNTQTHTKRYTLNDIL
jgi:hypothetical protein